MVGGIVIVRQHSANSELTQRVSRWGSHWCTIGGREQGGVKLAISLILSVRADLIPGLAVGTVVLHVPVYVGINPDKASTNVRPLFLLQGGSFNSQLTTKAFIMSRDSMPMASWYRKT
jgi:hypothetical protein